MDQLSLAQGPESDERMLSARRDAGQARDGFAMLVLGAALFWVPVIWPLGIASGFIGALLVISGRRAFGSETWRAQVAAWILLFAVIGGSFLAGLIVGMSVVVRADVVFFILLTGFVLLAIAFGFVVLFLALPVSDKGNQALLVLAFVTNLTVGLYLLFVFGPWRAALGPPMFDYAYWGTSLGDAFFMMRYAPALYAISAPFYAAACYRARARVAIPDLGAPPPISFVPVPASPPEGP